MSPSGTPQTDANERLLQLRDELAARGQAAGSERFAVIAVEEAIQAALEGNAGVGALLVDPDDTVVHRDHNRMFVPQFRSDLHAEMVVLSAFEDAHPDADLQGCTLYTSLEPCDMCTIRLINSGVSNVRYIAADSDKGATTRLNQLAPHWARLAEKQSFGPSDCATRLSEIALEAFELTIGGVTERLFERRGEGLGG